MWISVSNATAIEAVLQELGAVKMVHEFEIINSTPAYVLSTLANNDYRLRDSQASASTMVWTHSKSRSC